MLISLGELKPSPWNPKKPLTKKPLTKKQLTALKNNIKTFDFKRSLCVCKDFQTGEGFFVLDGNTAIDILKELGKKKVDCHIVEKVVDEKTLQKFMAGYSINKTPLYSEFASVLGEIDFSDFAGLDFGKFPFDVNIAGITESFLNEKIEPGTPEKEDEQDNERDKKPEVKAEEKTKVKPATVIQEERQTQYFLTLPPDCVEKLRNFVKTKTFSSNKTEAIAQKIDAMNDTRFLENILQIVL